MPKTILDAFDPQLVEPVVYLIPDVFAGASWATLKLPSGMEHSFHFRSDRPGHHELFTLAVPVCQNLSASLSIGGSPSSTTPQNSSPELYKIAKQIGHCLELFLQIRQQETESQALANLLDSMPDAVVTCDEEGMLQQFNRVARKWHGTDPRQIPPELWSKYFDLYETDGETLLDTSRIPLLKAFHGQTIEDDEIAIKAHGQDMRIVSCNGGPIQMQGKTVGALVLMHDITHERHVDQIRTGLISTVSHELRTPLTSLSGSLKLISSGIAGPLPQKAKDLLIIAERSSERLQLLVNDLLNLDRLRSGQAIFNLQELKPERVIGALIEELQQLANKKQQRIIASILTPRLMVADDVRVKQALTNLIANALKHSPNGSTVELKCTESQDHLRVSVLDMGPGVPQSFVPRLFEEFSQAYDDRNTQKSDGSGLGLSICKALVEGMAGRIGYRPRAQGGSDFWFELPAVNETAGSLEINA